MHVSVIHCPLRELILSERYLAHIVLVWYYMV